MRIDNQPLLDDVLSIVSQGAPYTDARTGEVITGVPFSDIGPGLRRNIQAPIFAESGRAWKNVSNINEGDLRDSGFTLVRSFENPNDGKKGDWKDCRGRSIGRWTTIITL